VPSGATTCRAWLECFAMGPGSSSRASRVDGGRLPSRPRDSGRLYPGVDYARTASPRESASRWGRCAVARSATCGPQPTG
jgi:hypothetical protein